VPPAERWRRAARLALRRLLSALARRRLRILLAVLVYAGLCLLPLLIGQLHLTLLALLPLVLVPPLGYLTYRLAWHEFHR
jgi:hypothetical protein